MKKRYFLGAFFLGGFLGEGFALNCQENAIPSLGKKRGNEQKYDAKKRNRTLFHYVNAGGNSRMVSPNPNSPIGVAGAVGRDGRFGSDFGEEHNSGNYVKNRFKIFRDNPDTIDDHRTRDYDSASSDDVSVPVTKPLVDINSNKYLLQRDGLIFGKLQALVNNITYDSDNVFKIVVEYLRNENKKADKENKLSDEQIKVKAKMIIKKVHEKIRNQHAVKDKW